MRRPTSLAARLLTAQLVVIVIAGVTLITTILLVAPGLFTHHLAEIGENSPEVQAHAEEAFEYSVGLALLAAVTAAVAAAGLLSWFLTRRVSRPIEDLAAAAGCVAAGNFDVAVPRAGFGRELLALSTSFQGMAAQLAATDAARGRLLADLAHEIRTPLATLEAHVDGLEDGVVPPSEQTYATMRAQAARLRRLSDDIRQAADAQEHALKLHPQPVAVVDLVRTACAGAAARYQAAGVDLRAVAHACGAADVDTDRMQQVLTNLLDNALRHTPAGGSVTVSCDGPGRGGMVVVEVADTGEGIPADQLQAVFDRFHRVDESRRASPAGGSGLGLTIARAIVVDHGGTLTAHSAGPGQGTTMRITLPAL
jgi:signal transduction histidine kinase